MDELTDEGEPGISESARSPAHRSLIAKEDQLDQPGAPGYLLLIMHNDVEEHPLNGIGRTFAAFRIVHPAAEVAMRRSLTTYGQMSPVICAATPSGLEMIDGFKRLRAAEHLQWETVKVVRLPTTLRACKAGIIQLNRVSRSISDLEEAMVLRSLHRDDGMPQTELAALLGRDKSWVSRRISLVERLIEEVWHHLVVGLIPVSIGRELAKLPRGNQAAALTAILKHRLGKRETESLVRFLLTQPHWQHDMILRNIRQMHEEGGAAPPTTARGFFRLLNDLDRRHHIVSAGVALAFFPESERDEALVRRAIASSMELAGRLRTLLADTPVEEF